MRNKVCRLERVFGLQDVQRDLHSVVRSLQRQAYGVAM